MADVELGSEEPKKVDTVFERVAREMLAKTVSQGEDAPTDEKTLRESARALSDLGYRVSPESLAALDAYDRGYDLCISGSYGAGKTFLFETINENRERRARMFKKARRKMTIFKMRLASLMKPEDIQGWLDENRAREVVLDDVGAESEFKNYGSGMEIFPYLLDARMGIPDMRTHITTNLSGKEVIERYGRRVADRLTAFWCIRFIGPSQRHPVKRGGGEWLGR